MDNLTQSGIRRLAAGWESRRLDAEEDLADIELRRGSPEQVLDRLRTLAAAHPDRSRLAAVLARALAATGRTDQARAVLAEADHAATRADAPHPGLVQARQALVPRATVYPQGAAASVAAVMPFQLPADTVHFTGRADHLARLLDLRPADPQHDDGPATVMVTVVEGMAGVGKTALALHAAHRLAGRFPDGILFTDLCGFTPELEPTPPEQALDRLLRGLGVPGPGIPSDLQARAGLYRSVLAHRRVLILLDNAAHEAQLEPLLPATAGCAVIVTSRRRLAGLDDATHLTLSALEPADAACLFRRVAGDRVTPADHNAVERIVALCGQLPLAIRIAATRLRLSPARSVAALCAELADALSTGSGVEWLSDGHRAVAAALAVSYRHLAEHQQHALRLIGLHPGPSIEPYALAALANTTVHNAQILLERLHSASLLTPAAHLHYTVHDLVAAYATTLAADLPGPERHTALDRLYDHYAATSAQAVDLTWPWEADQRPSPPATDTPTPKLSDRDEAQAWLDTEADNLLATAHHAATGHRVDHTLRQSATLRQYLRTRGHLNQAALLHQQGLDIARRTGNHAAEPDALTGLGYVHYAQGRCVLATECFAQALDMARQTGNRTVEQDVLRFTGYVHYAQGRYGPATECYGQALHIARTTGKRSAEPYALRGLGYIHYAQDRYGPAADCYEQALDIARHTADRNGQFEAHHGLGRVHHATNNHKDALRHQQTALRLAVDLDQPADQARAHDGLAHTHHALNNRSQARHHWQSALALLTSLGIDHTDDPEVTTATIRDHLAFAMSRTPSVDAGEHDMVPAEPATGLRATTRVAEAPDVVRGSIACPPRA